MDTLQPLRLAPLGGRISWRTLGQFQSGEFVYRTQCVHKWTISSLIHKPYRLVRLSKNAIPGLVLYETDSKAELDEFIAKLTLLLQNGFHEQVQIEDLTHGDAISVPSGTGRHYALFDEEEQYFIEYQGAVKSLGSGQVVGLFFHGFFFGTTGL
jgi:hypothetical protein